TTLGFWFFQNPVSVNPDGTIAGLHTVGDIFIVADFPQSGTQATISAYKWVGPGGSTSSLQLLTTDSTNLFAIVNTSNTPSRGWPFTSNATNPPTPANTFAPLEFLEGGIDLTALGLPDCNSTFVVETRASNSLTATLSDFAIGQITTCAADLAVTKTDGQTTAVPGASATYTITVTNNGPEAVSGAKLSD